MSVKAPRPYSRTHTRRGLLTVIAALALSAQAALATTFNPANSAAFTTALSQAQLGDTIILQAGTIYEGTFTLPNRTTGSGYITIQSSNLASLPAAGTRVSLSNASNMPRIRPTNAFGPAITTATSAHHFKLIGLEITGPTVDTQPDGVSNITWAPIELGTSGTAQDTQAEVPNNIIIDRCIVRANSSTQRIKRGIGLNSAFTDINDSYIADFKAVGQDCQAIGGYNGPGPFNIINNFIEGSTENLIFGGSDASITNLVPSNIVVKKNYFTKKLSWKNVYLVKNIFELKNARNVVVEGNIFEHCWIHGQTGYAILFTPRNQDGTNPWTVIENVTFKNNIVRKAGAGFQVMGDDNLNPSQQTNQVNIENNLLHDINVGDFTGTGYLALVSRNTDQVTFNHNTAFFTNQVIEVSETHTGFVFKNNIVPNNAYGIRSGIASNGNALNTHFNGPTGVVFAANVLMGGPANAYSQYPGNWFPSSWTGVLQNQASPGTNLAGWKVVNGSVYDNGGTDGKDVGCDIDALNTATQGCITGVWPGSPPPSSGDIVVYAAEAHKLVGTWAVTSDATAAGGSRIGQPNAGVPKINTPAANPGNYFEVSFQAQANTPYHIWVRGKALNNDWANDSAYAQFDNSVDSGGAAIWRIGTTNGTVLFLEEGSGAGLSNWGWNDNDYNATPGVLGQNVIFNKSGTQIMRVQQREDGYQIDQIVLSPATYLTTRPGTTLNDNTILAEAGTNPVNIVLHAKNAPTRVGSWTNTTDATAASGARIGQPNAGVPKIDTPAASPANYFEMSFFAYANTPYHIWFRGKALNNDWANDSAHAQFNNSVTSGGTATWRIGTTSGTVIFLEEGSGAGLSNWGWNDNDYNATPGVLGANVYFSTTGPQTIRVQQREDGYQVDQIVLSPSTYLTTRPGTTLNDTTILPEQQ